MFIIRGTGLPHLAIRGKMSHEWTLRVVYMVYVICRFVGQYQETLVDLATWCWGFRLGPHPHQPQQLLLSHFSHRSRPRPGHGSRVRSRTEPTFSAEPSPKRRRSRWNFWERRSCLAAEMAERVGLWERHGKTYRTIYSDLWPELRKNGWKNCRKQWISQWISWYVPCFLPRSRKKTAPPDQSRKKTR